MVIFTEKKLNAFPKQTSNTHLDFPQGNLYLGILEILHKAGILVITESWKQPRIPIRKYVLDSCGKMQPENKWTAWQVSP